jgi:GT2 family glycosyltransferase/glycosyltransferase involved in cell wall biosynthesis
VAIRLARTILGHAWSAHGVLRVVSWMVRAPAGLGLRRAGRRLEVALTKRLHLFDRPFYAAQFDAGTAPAGHPLRDYIERGDSLGRHPAPLFDPRHYRDQIPDRGGRRVNALLHYGLYGRFQGLSPSPWFDIGYYLRSNPDVARSGMDPLQHFARFGWREGRNPLPGLDLRVLLRDRPGLRVSKSNPLVHMLGELGSPTGQMRELAAAGQRDDAAALLDPAHWRAGALAPRAGDGAPQVDVLVPVHSGTAETLGCLWSVLAAPVRTAFELVVIDDAAPDPALAAMLAALAAQGLFTLRRNAANLGFVGTVNSGLRLHPQRDVVILNADTEVHNDWLDRLLKVAASDPAIGCVTPLSNNATLCSYPETMHNNWMALEVDDAELDRLAAAANGSQHVGAPTGVGFCMLMRRSCLDQIGLLDEKNFGRGYGEENDWCQRALGAGWLSVLAGGVFVRHHGSISFRSEAAERSAHAQLVLQRLHPTYADQVRHHIAGDPMWPARARLDLARLSRFKRDHNTLLVSHDRGGGTERHVMEQAAGLQAAGQGVFELRPSKRGGAIALNHPQLFGLHAVGAIPVGEREFLRNALRQLGITAIQLHQTIDFPGVLPELLRDWCGTLGIALQITVHDYHAVCPRINLARADGLYCGEPDAAGCNTCLASDGLRASSGDIVGWRQRQHALLALAQHVVVPDDDVAERLQRYFPALRLEVRAHDTLPDAPPRQPAPARGTRPVRALVLGAISRIKGYDVLLQAAQTARRQGLPIEFSLLGFSMDDTRLADAGVHLLGRYDDTDLDARLEACDPDLVFLPSIWPETYCYTLSAALRSGRPVVVFDLGAQARRVRAQAGLRGQVLPLALARDPARLLRQLVSCADERPAPGAPAAQAVDHPHPSSPLTLAPP